jgi:hypothetical protein
MAKKPWIDLDTDAVQAIRMYCRELEDNKRPRPLTLKAKRLAYKIAGIYLAPTNEDGVRYLRHKKGWERESLARFGINPRTYQLVDKKKWDFEKLRIEQEEKVEQIAKEEAERRESISKAIKLYQAPQPQPRPKPQSAKTSGQIISELALNQAAKKHFAKVIPPCDYDDDTPAVRLGVP